MAFHTFACHGVRLLYSTMGFVTFYKKSTGMCLFGTAMRIANIVSETSKAPPTLSLDQSDSRSRNQQRITSNTMITFNKWDKRHIPVSQEGGRGRGCFQFKKLTSLFQYSTINEWFNQLIKLMLICKNIVLIICNYASVAGISIVISVDWCKFLFNFFKNNFSCSIVFEEIFVYKML